MNWKLIIIATNNHLVIPKIIYMDKKSKTGTDVVFAKKITSLV